MKHYKAKVSLCFFNLADFLLTSEQDTVIKLKQFFDVKIYTVCVMFEFLKF